MKYLGIIIHENLTWSEHIKILSSKINKRIGILKRVRHLLPQKELVRLYNAIILPLFDYGDIVWGDKSNKCLMDDLQILQNKAAKVILGLPRANSSTEALKFLHWVKLYPRREMHRRAAAFKYINGLMEVEFNMIRNSAIHSYSTRGRNNLHLPKVKTEWGKQRFAFHAAKDWNDLDDEIRNIVNFKTFKRELCCQNYF